VGAVSTLFEDRQNSRRGGYCCCNTLNVSSLHSDSHQITNSESVLVQTHTKWLHRRARTCNPPVKFVAATRLNTCAPRAACKADNSFPFPPLPTSGPWSSAT
jgi:hypothetical protein